MTRPIVVLAVLLAANSLYLGARSDATLWYAVNVFLHIVLGVALLVAGMRAMGRRATGLVRRAAAAFALTAAAGLVLAVGGYLPLLDLVRVPGVVLVAHLVLGGAAALLGLLAIVRTAPTTIPAAWKGAAAMACVLAIASPMARVWDLRNPPVQRIVNPALAPASMDEEGARAGHAFFPSSAETNVGGVIPATFFMTSASCGRCHKEIYEQWRSSVHRFSSFNNQWYRKSIEYMQDVVGTAPSKWCAGCHDHAVFFNGRFDRPIKEQIDTAEAQNGLGCTSCHSITNVKSTMGQGDFTIEYPALHDLAASGNPLLQRAHDYLVYVDPLPHKRTFLKSFHREQTPEFCSSCHKVHLDAPVNAYRWMRGFNDYDNWQASGVSGEGARSFYYPAKPQKCADCHMPLVAAKDPAAKNGMVKSHRFPAANTAIPFVNGDAEQLRVTQAFLQDGQISVDVFGIVREPTPAAAGDPDPQGVRAGAATQGGRAATTFAVGEEAMEMGSAVVIQRPADVLAPLDTIDVAVRRGESVRVEVVVRTRKVGHFFPGGTVDAFDVWVELEAVDSNGRTILHSGALEAGGKGPVEPGAHFYRSLLLDESGGPINKRNAWMARSVAYVRLVPPGAADTVHYRLDVPPDAGDRIMLKAKVNYRKFAWWHTQWAFAGVRDPADTDYELAPSHDTGRWIFTGDTSRVSGGIKAIPNLPITVMATSEASVRVVPAGATSSPDNASPDVAPTSMPAGSSGRLRERWNDYGIGLLLQGGLKAAEAAFLRVTEIEPGYADGWVNVGRARLQEGNLPGAEDVLRRALAIDPSLAKTHFFLGVVLKGLGRYDEALGHLREASSRYPRDRVVLNQIGRVLFLQRKYAEAVDALARVLAIDPEDLQAHYNLMLAYRGLGQTDRAMAHETRYRRFKADESSQAITGPYRNLHPHDNNERQAIHEHRGGGIR